MFDRFWNSNWVVPQEQLGGDGTLETLATERARVDTQLKAATILTKFSLPRQDWAPTLTQLEAELAIGSSEVFTDTQDDDHVTHHIIECPALAAQLATVIERDLKAENAWQISLDGEGKVQWKSGEELRHEAPAREQSQRFEEMLHRLVPADLY